MAKILLIDDDNDVRTMLRLTLAHFGHTVIEASNGRAGVNLFRQEGGDLLITDIVMPEKDGLEVVMEIKRVRPSVKIIAISGGGRNSATEYLHIAKLMGASKVIAKPFSSETLMAAVDELLAAGGPAVP